MTVSETQTAVNFLSKLVACPSVNPGHQENFSSPFGEERLLRILCDILEPWGANIEIREVLPGRPNLIASFRGVQHDRCLMFEAHSDTVPVEGMSISPFEPTIKEGRLYGRGSCDTKGSMAAMLLGIRQALDQGPLPVTVHFVTTCDEEHGAKGAARLMQDGFRTDFAIVGEPTELAIVHAHKGAIRWRLHTHGKAAHSSQPERGVNAISLMTQAISLIEGPICDSLSLKTHAQLGNPTISIGTIHGGTQVNVVPDHCAVEIDRRIVPGEDPDAITNELIQALNQIKAKDNCFWFTCEELERYYPFEQDLDSSYVQMVRSACQKILGKDKLDVAPWCANTGFFHQAGIPGILLGPGSIKQAHTEDEWIEIEQVVQAAKIYAEIIRGSGEYLAG